MGKEIETHGGYKFRPCKLRFHGNVTMENGQRFIELADELAGAERVSVLIFEMTNAWQAPKHESVEADAHSGKIGTVRKFGLWHEAIELDGLRLHRTVLE